MKKSSYSVEQIRQLRDHVQKLIAIVAEIETEFPERHFTLDGHLVGSIGEVMAAYHYGVQLYAANNPVHDGVIGGRRVQIKISQQDNIAINAEPDYLLVMYLSKQGKVFEVYNVDIPVRRKRLSGVLEIAYPKRGNHDSKGDKCGGATIPEKKHSRMGTPVKGYNYSLNAGSNPYTSRIER